MSLTICYKNDFQEISIRCWHVFHHGCHLNRLLEICTCDMSVLDNVFFPGCTHVAKVTSLTAHLFPSGTWVENASQKRCQAIAPSLHVLVLQHSPRFESMTSKNQGNERKGFTFTLVVSNARSVLLTNKLLPSKPLCLMKAVCSAATSRCAPMQARCPYASPVCVTTVEDRDANGVPCVQHATCFSCHAARAWGQTPSNHCITSSCCCERATEEDESNCLPSNSSTTKFHSALSRLSDHV